MSDDVRVVNKDLLAQQVAAALTQASEEMEGEVGKVTAKSSSALVKEVLMAIHDVAINKQDFEIINFGTFTTTDVAAGTFVGKDPKTGDRVERPTPAFTKVKLKLGAAGKRLDSGLSNPVEAKRAYIPVERLAEMSANSDSGFTGAQYAIGANFMIQSMIDGLAAQKQYKFIGILNISGIFKEGGKRNVAGRMCDVADKVAVSFKPGKKGRVYG